jgi:hypothetical protein
MIGQHIAEAQKIILDTQIKIREVDLQIRDLEGKLTQIAPTQQERTESRCSSTCAARGRHGHSIPGHQRILTPFYDASAGSARAGAGTRRGRWRSCATAAASASR